MILTGTENSSGKTELLLGGLNTPYGATYSAEILKAIDSVTPVEIQKAASLYLSRPSVISIVANKDALDFNKNYLTSIGQVEKY